MPLQTVELGLVISFVGADDGSFGLFQRRQGFIGSVRSR